MGKRLVRLHVLHPTTLDRLAAALDSSTLTAHGAIKTKQMLPKRGPLAKYELCACHFLQGTALVDVRCSIYEKRPEVCRKAVRPGDRVCREVRRKVRAQLEESDG